VFYVLLRIVYQGQDCTTMVGGLCTIVVSHAQLHVGSIASSLMFVCLVSVRIANQ
jgi:hypothetical protein